MYPYVKALPFLVIRNTMILLLLFIAERGKSLWWHLHTIWCHCRCVMKNLCIKNKHEDQFNIFVKTFLLLQIPTFIKLKAYTFSWPFSKPTHFKLLIQKYSSYPLYPVPSICLPMCPPTQISQTTRSSSSTPMKTKRWIWWTTKRSKSSVTAHTSYTCTYAARVWTASTDRAVWSYAWTGHSQRSPTSPWWAERTSSARAYTPLSTCRKRRGLPSTSTPRAKPSRLRTSRSAYATCWGSASSERERLGRSRVTLQRLVQSTWTTGLELKEYTLVKTRPTVQNRNDWRPDSAIAWMYLLIVECLCISL